MFNIQETVPPTRMMLFFFMIFYVSAFLRHSSAATSIYNGEPSALQFHDSHSGSVQLFDIVEALIGSGDQLDGWANVLQGADPSDIPLTATFFVPSNDALSVFSFRDDQIPALLMYHIVPFQLAFEDLLELETGSRLLTVLPNHTIQVTNNTRLNFTLDSCSTITRPDLYYNGAVSVHAISSLLNYSRFGIINLETAAPSPPSKDDDDDEIEESTDPLASVSWGSTDKGDHDSADRSKAALQCYQIPFVESALFAIATAKLLLL